MAGRPSVLSSTRFLRNTRSSSLVIVQVTDLGCWRSCVTRCTRAFVERERDREGSSASRGNARETRVARGTARATTSRSIHVDHRQGSTARERRVALTFPRRAYLRHARYGLVARPGGFALEVARGKPATFSRRSIRGAREKSLLARFLLFLSLSCLFVESRKVEERERERRSTCRS